jgi:hypothetical protein
VAIPPSHIIPLASHCHLLAKSFANQDTLKYYFRYHRPHLCTVQHIGAPSPATCRLSREASAILRCTHRMRFSMFSFPCGNTFVHRPSNNERRPTQQHYTALLVPDDMVTPLCPVCRFFRFFALMVSAKYVLTLFDFYACIRDDGLMW